MVSVIIVNWNAGDLLRQCIESLIANHAGLVDKVVVIDNGSTDRSIADLRDGVGPLPFALDVVENGRNLGFAAACNVGAALADSEHLLFLNPDARLYTDTLRPAVGFMQDATSANVGVVGVQLIDESGTVSRSCCRFPTLGSYLVHIFALNRLSVFGRMGMRMHDWAHDTTRDVDHVIGAFYLIRRKVFQSLGGFDERFFVYLEDLDLSLRVREQGLRTVFLSHVQAFHAGGGTSSQVKVLRLFYSLRSRLLYGFKHFSGLQAWLLLLLTVTVEPLTRSCLALLQRSVADFRNTWKAHRLLVRDLANIVRVENRS
jgi:GT2 family glycosyltransferase